MQTESIVIDDLHNITQLSLKSVKKFMPVTDQPVMIK